MMQTLLEAMLPHLIPVLSLVVTLLLGLAYRKLAAWTGIEIEKAHRDALHRAIMSGLMAALKVGKSDQTVIEETLAHVQTSVPDALTHFQAPTKVLERIVRGKLNEAKARMRSATTSSGGD